MPANRKGAGIGAFLVPEHKVARMAASYMSLVGTGHAREQKRRRYRRLSGSRA